MVRRRRGRDTGATRDGGVRIGPRPTVRIFWTAVLLIFGPLTVLALVSGIWTRDLGAALGLLVSGAIGHVLLVKLRTRFEASAEGLALCNGYRTVRLAWSDVVFCGGLSAMAPGPILAIGTRRDEQLVVAGRVRSSRPVEQPSGAEARRSLVIALERPDVVIPIIQVWGPRGLRRQEAGGLLVVDGDGHAYLSVVGPVGRHVRGVKRRFARVLRDIADLRARHADATGF